LREFENQLKMFIIPENQAKKYREKYQLSKREIEMKETALRGSCTTGADSAASLSDNYLVP